MSIFFNLELSQSLSLYVIHWYFEEDGLVCKLSLSWDVSAFLHDWSWVIYLAGIHKSAVELFLVNVNVNSMCMLSGSVYWEC